MTDTHEPNIVVVTGDVTMDWNLARTRRSDSGGAAWNADDCTRAYWQRGGAALLADLIEAVANELRQSGQSDFTVRQMKAPRKPVNTEDRQYHHSYAMWSLFKCGLRPPLDKEKPSWRVDEFLGLDLATPYARIEKDDWKRVKDDVAQAAVVVLDDADLGFRKNSDLWPRAIRENRRRRPWILLKLARPVAQGGLWDYLHSHRTERLIVVMTVNDLRLTEVQISRELSWERTAQDIAWEIVYNPLVNALSHCAHVVISFDTAGAVLVSRAGQAQETSNKRAAPGKWLFFDPAVVEGAWGQDHPGKMIGYTSCLAAGIVRQLMLSPEKPDIKRGIQSGMAAMRKLHLEGYGQRGSTATTAQLAFPLQLVAFELAKQESPFAEAAIENPMRFLAGQASATEQAAEAGFWTILEDRYTNTLSQVAQQIVMEGPEEALQHVPLGRFGNLLTVDRREIESFRSISALVGQYTGKARPKRPLNIAVFGAPGSGKSFGIVEVADSLLPGQIKVIEFNLSQFSDPGALLGALHQVRDVGLSGSIPLVFWDEFDSMLNDQPLGWLRHFLAPMQDGRFQEGQVSHPIGRSIFVFAGGVNERLDQFDKGRGDEKFREAKGPDFVSRLKGFVNILGPNRTKGANDPYYVIRRAILLRSILYRDAPHLFEKKDAEQLLNIDTGVLRALLNITKYEHGVRSMESLIAMSLLKGKHRFERSCLPATEQLELHVNAREFQSLVQQMDLEGEMLEKLARANHEVFRESLRAKGYRYGKKTDDKRKRHSSLEPYDQLPEDEKDQNRGAIKDIANKLGRVGYVMIPARSNEPPFGFPGLDLEMLADMEHERWMKAKIEAGWRYDLRTIKAKQIHKDLLPWRKLSDEERTRLYTPEENAAIGKRVLPQKEKEKDRELVRAIPRILAEAGFTIVRVGNEKTNHSPNEFNAESDGRPQARRQLGSRRNRRNQARTK